MSKAKDFLDAVRGYTQQPAGTRAPAQDRPPKMGTVDAAYTGAGPAKVKFDGETTTSTKAYTLINCQVAASDRVALIPLGKTLVIIGTIGTPPQLGMRHLVTFTAGGTFSKASYPWLRAIGVHVIGGGAGGGGCPAVGVSNHAAAGGGGAGGPAESFITDIAGLSSSVTVTIGAAGAGGTGGASGGDGGSSSFGTLVVATGGTGGGAGTNSALEVSGFGGAGGVGTAGDIQGGGAPGGMGAGVNTLGIGGGGGSSSLGGGGAGAYTGASSTGHVGNPATGYGAGGGGASANASSSAKNGGAGSAGIVIVELFA